MKISSPYFSRLLLLKLLAPDIVEAILDARQPESITLPGLMEPFPVEWGVALHDIARPSHSWDANPRAVARCWPRPACR
jgi:hypothetical protein